MLLHSSLFYRSKLIFRHRLTDIAPLLRWEVDGCLGAGLVDADLLASKLGDPSRSQLQAARNRILVRILNHAVVIRLFAARDFTALAHANINNQATVVPCLEQRSNGFLLVLRICPRHRRDPD